MLPEATLEVGTLVNTDGGLSHHPSIFGACGAAIVPLHARCTKSMNNKWCHLRDKFEKSGFRALDFFAFGKG
jgi:hypothetical protein